MFLSIFKLTLIRVSICILHHTTTLISSCFKLTLICANSLLDLLTCTTKFIILPITFIGVSVCKDYLSFSTLRIISPGTLVFIVAGDLYAFTRSLSFGKFSYICTFDLYFTSRSILGIFLPFFYTFLTIAMLEIILELTFVLEMSWCAKISFSLSFSHDEISLIEETILFITIHEDTFAVW